MPVNFIIQSENVKARQEESTMKIRKYACIAISAALLMTGCQATPDQDIVANKNDNQASQNETSLSVDDTIATQMERSYLKQFLIPLIPRKVM